ncbi:MAG: hypothetical protein AB2693_15985 [Candidatus Thiodiazotropha sp.]
MRTTCLIWSGIIYTLCLATAPSLLVFPHREGGHRKQPILSRKNSSRLPKIAFWVAKNRVFDCQNVVAIENTIFGNREQLL